MLLFRDVAEPRDEQPLRSLSEQELELLRQHGQQQVTEPTDNNDQSLKQAV